MNNIEKPIDCTMKLQQYYDTAIDSMHNQHKHDQVYDSVYYVLAMKSKRIRPLLLLQASQLFGGIDEEVLPAALSIELFHNFTLVHDDIMDKAPLRRGIPTVHKKYGLGTAINTGDQLMILSYKYLTQIKADYLKDAFLMHNAVSVKIMEGQSLDIDFETQEVVSVEEYLKMIELKTAVLIAYCLKLGSQLAGASVEEQALMYEFGRNIGICFQLKDDWLDIYGDHKTGKRVGGDILQNKKTFLHIKAWQLANSEQLEELKRLKEVKNDEGKINATLHIYDALGIGSYTEKVIDEHYSKAMSCLDQLNVNAERREPFLDLVHRIYLRKF